MAVCPDNRLHSAIGQRHRLGLLRGPRLGAVLNAPVHERDQRRASRLLAYSTKIAFVRHGVAGDRALGG